MSKYVVNYHGETPRRKYTAGQFLAEFAEVHGRSRVRDLRKPVRVVWVNSVEEPVVEICRTASAIFALFQRVAVASGAICRLSWKGCTIGPAGLYALNHAIRTPALRKGGLNIVRHWLENRKGSMAPLGCDLSDLFDYLEIRPIYRGKRRDKAPPSPTETQSPEAKDAIDYVYNTIISKPALYPRKCWLMRATTDSRSSSSR